MPTVFSSAENHYQFMDEAPFAKSFYRLRSVDFDGSFQLSHIIHIERATGSFRIAAAYPVPVSDVLNVPVRQ